MTKYLIIGAGPAGLSAAVALKKKKIAFEIVDAGRKVGGIWDIERDDTPMYESAHFISSKLLSGFQDYPMPKNYPDYPSHQLVQKYIESYANHHEITSHIKFLTKVKTALPAEEKWQVEFSDGAIKFYDGMIVATGITWHKNLPKLKGNFSGEYIHSMKYSSPSKFKDKRVLIIGGGNSGCDIACDAARQAKKAFISLRRGYYFIPKYIFGMPADIFKEKYQFPIAAVDRTVSEFLLKNLLVGKTQNFGLQKPDHRLMESHPIINDQLIHHLGHGDISPKVDIDRCEGNKVYFGDGSVEEIDLIVAATGYKRAFPFLDESIVQSSSQREIDLYLEIFSKDYHNLFFVGGIEVSSATFGLFGLQGNVIASTINAQMNSEKKYAQFLEEKRSTKSLKHSKSKYVDSLRHKRYVQKDSYKKDLITQIKRLSK